MLLGLGGHVLWRLWRERVHFHKHRHDDGTVHIHDDRCDGVGVRQAGALTFPDRDRLQLSERQCPRVRLTGILVLSLNLWARAVG
jgi:hypothetical protein